MKKLVSGLVIGTVLLGESPVFASANEIDVKEDLKNAARYYEIGPINREFGTNFKPGDGYRESVALGGAIYRLDPPESIRGDGRLTSYEVINSRGEINEIGPTTSNKPLYAGNNILDNTEGGADQDLFTPEFTYKYGETISTKTTAGFKLGEKVTATVKFPGFAEASSETTMELNVGYESSNSKMTEVTYKIPSQKLKVPAGKRYQVSAYLNNASVSGSINLYAEVAGVGWRVLKSSAGSSGTNIAGGTNIGELLKECKQYGWGSFDNYKPKDKNAILNGGKADFKSSYGTDFILKIKDITQGEKSSQTVRVFKVPFKRIVNN